MRERWSSRIGFLAAAIGSAVGLGSVWRFPTIVGENGGGAYLIPYLVAVFLCATPLMVLELSAGRHFATDVVSAFRSAGTRFALPGWIICAVVFVILSYYLVISGWTLAFAAFTAAGSPVTFEAFSSSYVPVPFFVITTVLAGIIVASGVRSGIERVSSFLIPFIVVLLVIMAAFALSLPGSGEGVAYYLTPDFTALLDPSLWLSAVGQSFFTLSIGMGILVTYGAYLGKEEDLLSSSLVISVSDLAISLLSGLVIFPVVFSFGLAPAMGPGLAFSVLPQGFALMPGGPAVAFGFFLLLFLAALLSSISMFEVVTAVVLGATGWSRHRVSALVTAGLVLAGLPAALSYSGMHLTLAGANVLDLLDNIAGTHAIIVTGILTSLVFSWGVDRAVIEEGIGSGSPAVRWIVPLCRYLIPAVLAVVLTVNIVAGNPGG